MGNHDVRLEVCSDPRLLGVVRGVLMGWMEAFELGEGRRHEVMLAVDEACSNAIRHAYEGRRDGSVELMLGATDEWIEITVSDQGVPCPAECISRLQLEAPAPDEVRPGGLGVKLIHEIFDEVFFCPGEESGNCVTMRMRRNNTNEVGSED
jgi:anti-sigma regulatory factor (Ser/Thr protein kinase)